MLDRERDAYNEAMRALEAARKLLDDSRVRVSTMRSPASRSDGIEEAFAELTLTSHEIERSEARLRRWIDRHG